MFHELGKDFCLARLSLLIKALTTVLSTVLVSCNGGITGYSLLFEQRCAPLHLTLIYLSM